VSAVADAIADGRIGGRLWLYSNYHCNLRCSYCLTESAPGVARRMLDPETIVARATEARDLGFTGLGVTGGEPFLLDWMPDLLARLARILPVIVLSNGTLFNGRRLPALEPLAGLPIHVQISLDSATPQSQRRHARARELRQGRSGNTGARATRDRRAHRHHARRPRHPGSRGARSAVRLASLAWHRGRRSRRAPDRPPRARSDQRHGRARELRPARS